MTFQELMDCTNARKTGLFYSAVARGCGLELPAQEASAPGEFLARTIPTRYSGVLRMSGGALTRQSEKIWSAGFWTCGTGAAETISEAEFWNMDSVKLFMAVTSQLQQRMVSCGMIWIFGEILFQFLFKVGDNGGVFRKEGCDVGNRGGDI